MGGGWAWCAWPWCPAPAPVCASAPWEGAASCPPSATTRNLSSSCLRFFRVLCQCRCATPTIAAAEIAARWGGADSAAPAPSVRHPLTTAAHPLNTAMRSSRAAIHTCGAASAAPEAVDPSAAATPPSRTRSCSPCLALSCTWSGSSSAVRSSCSSLAWARCRGGGGHARTRGAWAPFPPTSRNHAPLAPELSAGERAPRSFCARLPAAGPAGRGCGLWARSVPRDAFGPSSLWRGARAGGGLPPTLPATLARRARGSPSANLARPVAEVAQLTFFLPHGEGANILSPPAAAGSRSQLAGWRSAAVQAVGWRAERG